MLTLSSIIVVSWGNSWQFFFLQMAVQLSNTSGWHHFCVYCQLIHSLPLCCHPIPQYVPLLFTIWYCTRCLLPPPTPPLNITIRNICTLDASKSWLRLRGHALKRQSYPLVSQTPYFRLSINYPLSTTNSLPWQFCWNFHSPQRMNCAPFNDAVSFYFMTTADQRAFLIKTTIVWNARKFGPDIHFPKL